MYLVDKVGIIYSLGYISKAGLEGSSEGARTGDSGSGPPPVVARRRSDTPPSIRIRFRNGPGRCITLSYPHAPFACDAPEDL